MKKKTIVFLDIDGTIWDYSGVIPKNTYHAVRLLKENGHLPIICTGRAKGHVRDEKLLNMGFDGIIAACGLHVEYGGKIIFESFLPDAVVKKAVRLSKECMVPIVFEGNCKHWISAKGFEHDDFVHRMIDLMGDDAIIFDDYTPDMRPNKFSGDVLAGADYKRFRDELKGDICFIEHQLGVVPGILQAEYEGDPTRVTGVFEAVSDGASKARGIKILCDYLNMNPEDAFAVGDSNNDIEMINCVGTGIAMGNGSDDIKKVADYVTSPLEEDGLYKALDHFGLLG